ncbi:MAG: DUF1987 domain-containing protein [Bacteroidales bacterium]|nr:DUF1987 domain-containing protein [Bacteroidales bacterium]
MSDLYIRGTTKTPEVNFKQSGLIELKGSSLIENTKEFFDPIISWLEEYIKHPGEKTTVNFDFEYYNTSSQMWIFRIVEVLTDLVKLNKDIEFNWYYNEEEVQEAGMDLANLLNVEMKFHEIIQD